MTPVDKIYGAFLFQIEDDDLALYSEELSNKILSYYLLGAIARFRTCKKDLSIIYSDDGFAEYIATDLTDKEIEILALGMVCRWYQKIINTGENLKNYVSDHDFKKTSNASLLKQLILLKDVHETDFERFIVDYSYDGNESFE